MTRRIDDILYTQHKTRADLARGIGVGNSTVSSWFSKDISPSVDTAVKVAQFLDVSVEYLVTGKESAQVQNNTFNQSQGIVADSVTVNQPTQYIEKISEMLVDQKLKSENLIQIYSNWDLLDSADQEYLANTAKWLIAKNKPKV